MDSKSLFQRSLKVAPGGVHSPVRAFKSVGGDPLFFASAKGAYLKSVEGQEYIDYCMSFGPMILGHRDPEVQEAVQDMLNTAWSFGACEPYSLELAEWITSRLPWVEKLRFVTSGTEAVMSALRVARAATKKNKILKFDGCYHGHADSLLVKAGSGLAGESASDSAGVSTQTASDTLVAQLDDIDSVKKVFEQHPGEIAAVIIEPLPANYGMLKQTTEFWPAVCKLAKENGALVIFDEVISGFRVGMGGMAAQLKINPDLVTYGKVIGGGFPVGAYGGKKELMDMVAPVGPVYQAGTLSANPVGMRAGLATLKKVEREKVHAQLESRTRELSSDLRNFFQEKGIPLSVETEASIFWIHPSNGKPVRSLKDISVNHAAEFKTLFHAALKRGLYLAPSGFEVSFMSLAHDANILEKTLKVLKESSLEAYGKKTLT